MIKCSLEMFAFKLVYTLDLCCICFYFYLLIGIKRSLGNFNQLLCSLACFLKSLLCKILNPIRISLVLTLFATSACLCNELSLLHSICPVCLALEYEQMHELVVLSCLLSSDLSLYELLAALSELERLTHAVQLADAVVVVPTVVIVAEAVLVLS